MTTDDDFEPHHSSSPTDQVLQELQLYGYRPFQDEPDPRPLPEAQILAGSISDIFDALVVGVADSRNKKPFFTLEERLDIAHEVLGHYPNVQVMSFKGLLKDFVRSNNARVIVRGLRAVSDFEYEFQMAGMNRYLLPDVETMFMTPSDQYQFISGTIVREIAQLGGDVSKFVFPSVEKRLRDKVSALGDPLVKS